MQYEKLFSKNRKIKVYTFLIVAFLANPQPYMDSRINIISCISNFREKNKALEKKEENNG